MDRRGHRHLRQARDDAEDHHEGIVDGEATSEVEIDNRTHDDRSDETITVMSNSTQFAVAGPCSQHTMNFRTVRYDVTGFCRADVRTFNRIFQTNGRTASSHRTCIGVIRQRRLGTTCSNA